MDGPASLTLDPEKNLVRGNDVEHTTQSHEQHVLPDTEKRVIRKMDCRIIPLVTALYILAFLDRSNIGNARIAGMAEDLKLSSPDYQWLLTIFYITYIIFEFQALFWKIIPPQYVPSRILFLLWNRLSILGLLVGIVTLADLLHGWKMYHDMAMLTSNLSKASG